MGKFISRNEYPCFDHTFLVMALTTGGRYKQKLVELLGRIIGVCVCVSESAYITVISMLRHLPRDVILYETEIFI